MQDSNKFKNVRYLSGVHIVASNDIREIKSRVEYIYVPLTEEEKKFLNLNSKIQFSFAIKTEVRK